MYLEVKSPNPPVHAFPLQSVLGEKRDELGQFLMRVVCVEDETKNDISATLPNNRVLIGEQQQGVG